MDDHQVLSSGLKLCRLCGCLGQKACSRCHSVTYCSKEHQTIDWKHRHKKECSNEGECMLWLCIISNDCNFNIYFFIFGSIASQSSEELNSFLFPEWELVTESEELPAKDEKLHESHSLDQESMGCVNNGMPLWTDSAAWYFYILSRICHSVFMYPLRFGEQWAREYGASWNTGH